MIIQYIFSLAIVFIVSAINVYVRDVEYIINFIIMMLFYVTPILYNSTMFTGNIKFIFVINPMAHIINAYRDIFYNHISPNLLNLAIIGLISTALLIVAYKIFKKLEKGFVEEL